MVSGFFTLLSWIMQDMSPGAKLVAGLVRKRDGEPEILLSAWKKLVGSWGFRFGIFSSPGCAAMGKSHRYLTSLGLKLWLLLRRISSLVAWLWLLYQHFLRIYKLTIYAPGTNYITNCPWISNTGTTSLFPSNFKNPLPTSHSPILFKQDLVSLPHNDIVDFCWGCWWW